MNKEALIKELDRLISTETHPTDNYPKTYQDGYNAALLSIKHKTNAGKFSKERSST